MAELGKKNRPTFLFRHVFSDGFGASAICDCHLCDLLRVPNIGHIRTALFQLPIFPLPAIVHISRVQFAHFTSRVVWDEAVVSRGRLICLLPDHSFRIWQVLLGRVALSVHRLDRFRPFCQFQSGFPCRSLYLVFEMQDIVFRKVLEQFRTALCVFSIPYRRGIVRCVKGRRH